MAAGQGAAGKAAAMLGVAGWVKAVAGKVAAALVG